MNQNDKYQKQLTLQDRFVIEDGLNHGKCIASIARSLGKDISTISREVRKHRIGDEGFSTSRNDCMYRLYCQKQLLCDECTKIKRCNTCKLIDCRSLCTDYRSDMCKNTLRSPHVCNGCNCIYECRRPHFYYRANVAYESYKTIQRESRIGLAFSRQDIYELDCLITPLLKQGQSIAHIYISHKDEIPCSLKCLYNYIDQGIFTARNIDLPKKVKYRERKKKRKEPSVDYNYRENRTYKHYQSYKKENPETNVVELDTVHGCNKTGNVMLTLLFCNCNFMLIFLMPECTKECVKQVFDELTDLLGIEVFRTLFPIILTDNGPEFKGAEELENDPMNQPRTRVFYCDPLASWQKAKLEKNHEYIRKVIPKGISLINYTQEDMTLLANHINSTARASLNGRNPYELAQLLLHSKLFKVLNLKSIKADEVMLKPPLKIKITYVLYDIAHNITYNIFFNPYQHYNNIIKTDIVEVLVCLKMMY